MHRRLGGASYPKVTIHSISDTGTIHGMNPTYGSFLSYNRPHQWELCYIG